MNVALQTDDVCFIIRLLDALAAMAALKTKSPQERG